MEYESRSWQQARGECADEALVHRGYLPRTKVLNDFVYRRQRKQKIDREMDIDRKASERERERKRKGQTKRERDDDERKPWFRAELRREHGQERTGPLGWENFQSSKLIEELHDRFLRFTDGSAPAPASGHHVPRPWRFGGGFRLRPLGR